MKRKIFKLSFIMGVLISCLLFPFWIKAQTPSPTSEEEDSSAVQQIREDVKKKVQEKIAQIQRGKKRGYLGEITEVTDAGLTLNTPRGEITVQAAEEITILSQKRQEITFDDLEESDYIIAMGYLTEENILETIRIVVTKKLELPAREVAFGQVEDISSGVEQILRIKNEKKQISYMVEATGNTKITKKVEGKVQEVSFSKIEEGDRIVAIGTPGKDTEKIITAKIIHIIPGKATGQVTETPAETPTPTEAEEATPTPTPEE